MNNSAKKDPKKLPVDDLYSFINDFPALLWRIEILRARIDFLNDNIDVAPGINGTLLLKNIEYRNRIILPEDLHLFETFMDLVKEGKTAATIFRVKNQEDGISWLKLTGAANRKDPAYYYGYLLNADDTVSVIKGLLDRDLDLKLMIEDTDNPVFLLEYDDLNLICANPSAKDLFKLTETDFKNLSFRDLYCDVTKQALKQVFKSLPLSRKWNGKLSFQTMDKKNLIKANTIVRYLVHKGKGLIRLSLLNPKIHKSLQVSSAGSNTYDMDILEKKIANLLDINELMEACLASPLVSGHCDAILFSDVHVPRNKVIVYGAGAPFSGMQQAETFSYKGTIAQDIMRYSLDYLIVDDTQDSIKPIDWALFVPRGIRSYFAMPFFSRTALRTVLILCSTTPGRFAGRGLADYAAMFKTINDAIRAWRRRQHP